MTAQQAGEHAAEAAHGAEEGFNAGEVIIEHVSNSSLDHPIVPLPHIAGIDFSVTKHVMMMWLVSGFLFLVITMATRAYLKQERRIPTGFMNGLEWLVQSIRDSIVLPNVGAKFVNTWTPLMLTLFVFILACNVVGLIPMFETLGMVDRFVLGNSPESESLINSVLHGGTTATANYNVTAALATITFFSIMIAGTMAHGFVKHWKNLVPSGLAKPVYALLIPIELMGMFVKPFALTMRLAANMTGGHIAILSILSLVFLFAEIFASAAVGIGFTLVLPLAVGISALEIIVVMVQAYVFTLLTSVFIGMAINVHH